MAELTTESTVYVIYIAAAPEAVWAGLTSSSFTSRYFFGRTVDSDWRVGSPWLLRAPDGRADVTGTVIEGDPPRKLVLGWKVPGNADYPDLPESLVTYEIVPAGEGVVRLTMTEAHPAPIPVHLLEGGRTGWPIILSGLKSLLETGKPLKIAVPHPPKED